MVFVFFVNQEKPYFPAVCKIATFPAELMN